jgi:hypothetical protein
VGGTTDSFGPDLQPVLNGLGLVPYANGVHYDSEPQRQPVLKGLVAAGVLPDAYATEDGVGLLYRSTGFVEAVTELRGKAAYLVQRDGEGVSEERLDAKQLPGAR